MPTNVEIAIAEAKAFIEKDVTNMDTSDIAYGISLVKRITADKENVPDGCIDICKNVIDKIKAATLNVKSPVDIAVIQVLMMEAIFRIGGYTVREGKVSCE